MNNEEPITLLLAEDHAIVRQGLRTLLEIHGDLEVVGEATTGREAVELTRRLRPNVVVMDIGMPRLNGFEAARQIRAGAPDSKVIFLSAHSDDPYVELALECGAAGYLVKQNSAGILQQAIREVGRGRTFFSPTLTEHFRRCSRPLPARTNTGRPPGEVLTTRETEVLQLVAEGLSNKQVAAELGISIKTVEKHRQSLMKRLDIHDTAGLTRYAMTMGIIDAGERFSLA